MAEDGIDVAARDFVAGMTDRYAVSLFETLFIPKPWVGPLEIDT
jgi:dGTPase